MNKQTNTCKMAVSRSVKLYLTIFSMTTCMYMLLYQYHIAREALPSAEELKLKLRSNVNQSTNVEHINATTTNATTTTTIVVVKTLDNELDQHTKSSHLPNYNIFFWSPLSTLEKERKHQKQQQQQQEQQQKQSHSELRASLLAPAVAAMTSAIDSISPSTMPQLGVAAANQSSSHSFSSSLTSSSSSASSTPLPLPPSPPPPPPSSLTPSIFETKIVTNASTATKSQIASGVSQTKTTTIPVIITTRNSTTTTTINAASKRTSKTSTATTNAKTTTRTSHITIFEPALDPPPLYIITPTYRRPEQLAELTRLGYTLKHVLNMLWLVIEDAATESEQVKRTLNHIGVPYEYLLAPMPSMHKTKKVKPRGVSNRLRALAWLRENATSGVFYFADDDNTYDISIFEQMRYTNKVSMWPVGLVTKMGVSTPVIKNGKITSWYDGWIAGRRYPVDMAGFAVSVKFLLDRPKATMPYKPGYEEDGFLKSLEPLNYTDIELLASKCTEILVWHTQTKKNTPAVNVNTTQYAQTNLIEIDKMLVRP